uniref:Uncharacterized protein n=1 Tax=Rhabditophanes sp. KR3021 TaxID=114890 RepID=A0AC35U6A9_9BILA
MTGDVSKDETKVEEQRDGLFLQQQLGNYMPGMMGATMQNPALVNFDFQCKCVAKVNTAVNTPAPLDSNAQAQQQIQQLQEQLKRTQETIRKTQQGATPFETFANTLSLAEGLDCSCSGVQNGNSMMSSGMSGGMNAGINGGMTGTMGNNNNFNGSPSQFTSNGSQMNQMNSISGIMPQGNVGRMNQISPFGPRFAPTQDYSIHGANTFYPQ